MTSTQKKEQHRRKFVWHHFNCKKKPRGRNVCVRYFDDYIRNHRALKEMNLIS